MQRRKIGFVLVALLLIGLSMRPPSADIRINLHDAADTAPQKIVAAVDMGLLAVSVLVTWSKRIAR